MASEVKKSKVKNIPNEFGQPLMQVINYFPQYIFWKNLKLIYIGCNINFSKLMGFSSPKSIIGKTNQDLVQLSDVNRKLLKKLELKVIKTKREANCKIEIISPTHRKKIFFINISPFFNDKKALLGIVGFAMDVAENIFTKKVKDNSKRSQIYLENIVANLPHHVYWKDTNGVYLGGNDLQAITAGWESSKDLIGKSDYDILPKAQAEIIRANDQKIMRTGKATTLEEVATFSDGRTIVFSTRKVPLRDSNGHIIGLLGISTDITDNKRTEQILKNTIEQAEDRIKKTEIYLANIVAMMPGSIYWKDREGIYLGCNDFVAKMAGLKSAADVIGKTDYELPWKKMAKMLRDTDKTVMESRIVQELEESPILADGTRVTMLSFKAPLRDDKNNVIGIIGTSIDITARKKAEAALKTAKEKAEIANQAKSEFLASMSHDFRTPLNGMLGMAQVLRERLIDQNQIDFVNAISEAGNNLLHLIEDILDFSRIEAGEFKLFMQTFNIKDLLEDILKLAQHQIKNKKIRLISNYSDFIPLNVISDIISLRRILTNLIDNAIKFTDHGIVSITISCDEIKNDLAQYKIIVEDTGIGIPNDKINFIFERFGRVDPSFKSRFKGTGLGLSIVKQLVERLGGKVSVESKLQQGSKFIVTLPLKIEKNLQEGSSKHLLDSAFLKEGEQQLKDYKPSVLLVEDDLITQKFTQTMLNDIGCEVTTVDMGSKVFQVLDQDYDIVLMDIGLSDIDGFALTESIKKMTAYQSLPIIALTAHISDVDKAKCFEYGMSDFLKKPISKEDLIKVLVKFILGTKLNK